MLTHSVTRHAASLKVAALRGGLLLSLAAMTVLPPAAWAKPGFAQVSLTPAQFVANCQSLGGTSSNAPGGGIRCTLSSGQTVDCSFGNNGIALCQWSRSLPPATTKNLLGDMPPNSLNPNTSPKTPKVPGTVPGTLN